MALSLLPVVSRLRAADESRRETIRVATSAPHNRNVTFAVRVPKAFTQERAEQFRILVLFGGRNWPARRSLDEYDFDAWADEHRFFLLSPGFTDDAYWEPERWSGRALAEAAARLRKQYGLPETPLFYYGYSAGGQCANLFYAWRPEIVAAWAAHACGVWFQPRRARIKRPAPALVTCGAGDAERHALSRHFAYAYREAGGELIWRDYDADHALTSEPLELARAFFTSILDASPDSERRVGDDDTRRYYADGTREARRIPPEYANRFRTSALAEAWAADAESPKKPSTRTAPRERTPKSRRGR